MAKSVNLPDILPYQKIRPLEEVKELHGQFVYVIKSYPEKGLSVLIYREDEHLFVRIGDFDGNVLNPNDEPASRLNEQRGKAGSILSRLIETSKLIGIKQALFYISVGDRLRLVDMRISANKFAGPGYINDFFGKQIDTQDIIQPGIILTEENLLSLREKEKEFILKPSRFKFTMEGDEVLPMYGRVTNEAESVT